MIPAVFDGTIECRRTSSSVWFRVVCAWDHEMRGIFVLDAPAIRTVSIAMEKPCTDRHEILGIITVVADDDISITMTQVWRFI